MAFKSLLLAFSCVGAVAVGLTPAASAQDKYPNKVINYIVPFAAGGTTDVLGRLIGNKLGPAIGTTVVIENRPGAGGNIGSEYVARAAADGYTLVGGTISSHSINVSLYPKMSYDPVKSFQPVTLIGTLPNVLVVNANSPYKTVKDLLDAAKAKPGSLNFGSSGNGTSQHLAAELFQTMTSTKMIHVPYKGSSQAMQALLGEEVTLVFENLAGAASLIQSGKVRALAVTSSQRASSQPSVPTLAESGLPGYEIVSWQAIFAPAGTPQPVVQKLSTEIAKIIKDPEIKARFATLGVEPSGAGPEELAAFQKSEVAKWAQLIKTAGIKME